VGLPVPMFSLVEAGVLRGGAAGQRHGCWRQPTNARLTKLLLAPLRSGRAGNTASPALSQSDRG